MTKTLSKVQGIPETVNLKKDLDQVRERVSKLYGNTEEAKWIHEEIDRRGKKISYPHQIDSNDVAWINAMNDKLGKAIGAEYQSNNLSRQQKESEIAESNLSNLNLSNLKLDILEKELWTKLGLEHWTKLGLEQIILWGNEEERDWLANNPINRVITRPFSESEKRLIEEMIYVRNRRISHYKDAINSLVKTGLAPEEENFEIDKKLIFAAKAVDLIGDLLNWFGRGIFAPPTKATDTNIWKEHIAHALDLIKHYYRNLNPDREGAFNIKRRELTEELKKLGTDPDNLMTAEQFQEMMKLVSKYAEEQDNEKKRNLDELEKNLIKANEIILQKAEEIAGKEDELWKYKMLQMMIAFSPLAPLNILNHITEILAPLEHLLDFLGVDKLLNWIIHGTPLNSIAETLYFLRGVVSLTDIVGNLRYSPLTGILIDVMLTLVTADEWAELSILKEKAREASKTLNEDAINKANAAVREYEEKMIEKCSKEILLIIEKENKKLVVRDKLFKMEYADLVKLAGSELMNSLELKDSDLDLDDGTSKNSPRRKVLATIISLKKTKEAIEHTYNDDLEGLKSDAYFNMAKNLKIPHDNLYQQLKFENGKITQEELDYLLVKQYCIKNNIKNFDSIYSYKEKPNTADIAVSDFNSIASKPILSLSNQGKKKAEELKKYYHKQEDQDMIYIKNKILERIIKTFDVSRASAPELESSVKFVNKTPQNTFKPIKADLLRGEASKVLVPEMVG